MVISKKKKNVSFPAAQGECPQDWELYEGSCYGLIPWKLFSYYEADDWCRDNFNAYLTEITSDGEQDFVKDLIVNTLASHEWMGWPWDSYTSAWIGVEQTNDGYPWYNFIWAYRRSQKEVTYSKWELGAPDRAFPKKCAILNKEYRWKWTRDNCNKQAYERTFVCERDADVSSTSG